MAVVGDRWTLLILRTIFRGHHRFGAIIDDVGIARNLLSDRLSKLVASEVLERVPYQERPTRYEYRLTAKGADLSSALIALMRWGDTWYADSGPPIELYHRQCGHALDLDVSCSQCNQPVGPTDISSRPGPGKEAS